LADNFVICPFAALKQFCNPRNITYIPAVKKLFRLANQQTTLLSAQILSLFMRLISQYGKPTFSA
jgi:hypothetical protein